ncbi:hypothetical protein QZH41_017375, partial [Actinostola sp. cb2023]
MNMMVGLVVIINGGVSGDYDGGVSGDYDGGVSGDYDGGVSGDYDGGVSGDYDGGVSGDYDGGVSGDYDGGVSGDYDGGVSGDYDGGVSGDYDGGVSGDYDGVSGDYDGGVSGDYDGGVSGDYDGGVSGDYDGVSGDYDGGVSGDYDGGVSVIMMVGLVVIMMVGLVVIMMVGLVVIMMVGLVVIMMVGLVVIMMVGLVVIMMVGLVVIMMVGLVVIMMVGLVVIMMVGVVIMMVGLVVIMMVGLVVIMMGLVVIYGGVSDDFVLINRTALLMGLTMSRREACQSTLYLSGKFHLEDLQTRLAYHQVSDQVVSVNDIQVLNKSYRQVIDLIQKSRDNVELGIVPKEECVLQMIFVDSDDSLAPRVGRRVSYVMATSSSTTPRITLEGMKEEDDQPSESVPGLMEKSSVRSWKAVYAVLRGHILYFHKDRDSAHQTKQCDGGDDQQPISIKSSIVDIAHDYTKRKNVYRLTAFNGCEYLFQCEDSSSMMKWIEAIQANNNPDEDVSFFILTFLPPLYLIVVSLIGVWSDQPKSYNTKNEECGTGIHRVGVLTTSHSSGHKLTPTPSSAKMPNFSNLKKSLSFKNISGIQSKDDGNKNNKWHKGSKKRKKQTPNMVNFVQGYSIGVPLEICPLSKILKFVPVLVEHCCEVVDKKGIDCIGVYRVPGNSAAVTLLQDEVNNKGADNVNFEDEKWHDVNNITSLLKQFLRKLPEGIVTAELYEGFIEANKKQDPVERMWALKCLINELPDHNFETLKFLLAHLKRISNNACLNKMESRNLAIVFGPTLVRTGEDTMMSMVKDMSDQCRIVETILIHNEWFFEESGDGDEPPSKPPVTTHGQEHFVSMSVLSSLGQAAGNFDDDGNMKSKVTVKSKSTTKKTHRPRRANEVEEHRLTDIGVRPTIIRTDIGVRPTIIRTDI